MLALAADAALTMLPLGGGGIDVDEAPRLVSAFKGANPGGGAETSDPEGGGGMVAVVAIIVPCLPTGFRSIPTCRRNYKR